MKAKNSYFSRYLGYKLLKHKVLLIVSLVANILALPLMALVTSVNTEKVCDLLISSTDAMRRTEEFQNAFYNLTLPIDNAFNICVIAFAVLAVIALITPPTVMSYSYKQADSDMYLSLPISTKSRFFADTLAGAIISLFPLALNFLGGILLTGRTAQVLAEKSGAFNGIVMHQSSYLTVSHACELFNHVAVVGIIFVSCVYFISLFFAGCTSKKSTSIIYSIITPLILTGIGIFTSMLIGRTAHGITNWKDVQEISSYIAPFGILKTGWERFNDVTIYRSVIDVSELNIPSGIIITHIVACLLFLLGALICAVKRKAENTDKPFAIEFVYKIIITLFVALLVSAVVAVTAFYYTINVTLAIITMIIALIIYLTVQLIHYKSIKKLPKLLLHFGISATVFFAVFVGVAFSDGFGAAHYVPSPDEIESVEVSNMITGIRSDNNLSFIHRSDIELVTSLHKKCVEEKVQTGFDFEITYKLKNGETVVRSYEDGAKGSTVGSQVRNGLLSSPTTMQQLLPKEYKIGPDSYGSFILIDGTTETNRLSPNGITELLKAIRLDYVKGTLLEGKTIGRVSFCWEDGPMSQQYGTIFVKENSENVLEVLRDENNYMIKEESDFYRTTDNIPRADRIAVIIGDNNYWYNTKSDTDRFLYIRHRDFENEKVRELMSLVELGENGLYDYSKDYGVWVDKLDIYSVYIGIREENVERALTLINEIKADREKSGDNIDFTDFYLFGE